VRILIAAGGTGGHIFPALAIARALRRRIPDAQVEFVGTGGGLETDYFKASGFPLHQVQIRGLKGKKAAKLMGSFALLPQAFLRSWIILSQVHPDVAVGVGGYVSGPLLLLSAMRGIPTLVHEQNCFPGWTNRVLAPLVRQIAYSFPESAAHFASGRKKMTLTGNPIRREILTGDREEAARRFDLSPHRFTLLSFGGSQGASRINLALLEALPYLVPLREQIQFLHASGERDLLQVEEGLARSHLQGRVCPFIQEMASAYALADLVLCRAGATTIAELVALGKPSLLVPYPYAANDHQRHNAEALVRLGAAQLILDQDLNGNILARLVEEALRDPQGRELMGSKAKSLARIDADDRIADLVSRMASRS